MNVDRPVPLHSVVSVICDALIQLHPNEQAQALEAAQTISTVPPSVQRILRQVLDAVLPLAVEDQQRAVSSVRMILGVFASCQQGADCSSCFLVSEFVRSLREPEQTKAVMAPLDMAQKIMLMEILRVANPQV